MKERPIIFSTEMVKAILEGRKTQTRRVVKPQAHHYNPDLLQPFLFYPCNGDEAFGDIDKQIKSPYGYPWKEWQREKENDRLWVREAWKIWGWNDGEPFSIQYKDGTVKDDVLFSEEKGEDYWIQCADDCIKAGLKTNDEDIFVITGDVPTRWRPSIFMPREASRITLEIINIRVEHVQDISHEDRVKEGITFKPGFSLHEFRKLWNSIHKKANRWEDNPWVWVIEFKLINKPFKA